jgi:hypothetical protein
MLNFIRQCFQNKEIEIDKSDPERRFYKGKNKPKFTWHIHEEDYIKYRLGPFINYFDRQRIENRRKEQLYQYLIIGLGALIAIINVFGIEKLYSNVSSAILGGTIAALTAVLQFEKYHDRWISYKQAGTKLSNEYFKWSNGTGEYSLKEEEVRKEMDRLITDQEKPPTSEQKERVSLNDQKIRDVVEKKFKLALLTKRCEDIITSEAFDYVALFSSPSPSTSSITQLAPESGNESSGPPPKK